MFNVILVGPPGSGKTTIGRLLAQQLSAHFSDTDRLIEERTKLKVPEIFSDLGEQEFRRIEKDVVRTLAHSNNAVIATGGGTIVDPDNLAILQAMGTVVFLSAKVGTLKRRLAADPMARPLLEDLRDDKRLLENLLEQRQPFYQKADVHIKTDDLTPEQIVSAILGKLKN